MRFYETQAIRVLYLLTIVSNLSRLTSHPRLYCLSRDYARSSFFPLYIPYERPTTMRPVYLRACVINISRLLHEVGGSQCLLNVRVASSLESTLKSLRARKSYHRACLHSQCHETDVHPGPSSDCNGVDSLVVELRMCWILYRPLNQKGTNNPPFRRRVSYDQYELSVDAGFNLDVLGRDLVYSCDVCIARYYESRMHFAGKCFV